MSAMYQSNPFAMYPFLQYLLQSGGGGGGGAGANPFMRLYAPAPPGTSQTTAYPTIPTGPGAMPPPVMPPPSSVLASPMATAFGATPIGQVPPAPVGAVAAGQGGQGIPGGQGVPGAQGTGGVSPAAVPPFQAYTAPPPNPLVGAQQQNVQQGAAAATSPTPGQTPPASSFQVPPGAPPGTYAIGSGYFMNPAWPTPMTAAQIVNMVGPFSAISGIGEGRRA